MKKWQRYLRTAVALGSVVFAGAVVLSLRERRRPATPPPVATADPAAIVESAGGHTLRVNREREDVRVEYDRLASYGDGSTRMFGVKVITERAGARTFTVTADEGQSGQNESTLELKGHVHVTSSDGIDIRTETASYAEQDGTVRAPGLVEFTQGRTRGRATGFRYDKTVDSVHLLADVVVHLAQGAGSANAGGPGTAAGQDLEIVSRAAEYVRPTRTLRFEGAARAVRGTRVVEGELMVALLDASGDQLERLTLSGGSLVEDTAPAAGGLGRLAGRDIDLVYRPGGDALDHARVVGEGRLAMAGQQGPGSEIAAGAIAIVMAADGSTPVALDASPGVMVSLPVEPNAPARTISADAMTSRGEGGRGLTSARFEGSVVFQERGARTERRARSGALDVSVSAGLGSIDDARFSRGVRFEDGAMTAEAPAATYLVSRGTLSLRPDPPEGTAPRVQNERISVSARELNVVLDGPMINATGDVKSELRSGGDRPGSRPTTDDATKKVPSMLRADRPVAIAANTLTYDGKASRATYRGSAQLWQGETTIRAEELTLDERTGDLSGAGAVTTSIPLRSPNRSGSVSADASTGARRTPSAPSTPLVPSTASAQNLRYEESMRRATYTGQAHLAGDQGDLSATTIELYLKPSGDELERLEAYDAVTLRDHDRRMSGTRLTYEPEGERYLVTGAPVTLVDECARETIGRTLTFDRVNDRLVVDGSERARTRTKGRANCQ